jgi:hypothetical protein
MLMPRSHAWTPRQKTLIALAVLLGVIVFAGVVYRYERYSRPNDSVLFGTWREIDSEFDEPFYWRLNPDHTFETLSIVLGELTAYPGGRWYGGGSYIYFRPLEETPWHSRLFVWRLEDISENTLQVRYHRDTAIHTYKRVNVVATAASNQTMQPTASPRTASVSDD